jgi:sodium transport system permease protein
MKTVRTVFFKEVKDNFRDRRTLLTALLMGPLFGPILFAFVINLAVKQSLSNQDEALDLPVIGQEHAPNLIAYLESRTSSSSFRKPSVTICRS